MIIKKLTITITKMILITRISLSATAVTEFQGNFLSARQNRRLSWKWYELT